MGKLNKKLNEVFSGKVVRKDLLHRVKKGTNVPTFVLEFLLARYCASDDEDEIQAGIEITRKQDAAKAVEFEEWLDAVAGHYQILPMDEAVFRLWAKWMSRTSDTLYEDGMIAATARVHNLKVVTRNVGDFVGFDVRVFDPFTA